MLVKLESCPYAHTHTYTHTHTAAFQHDIMIDLPCLNLLDTISS